MAGKIQYINQNDMIERIKIENKEYNFFSLKKLEKILNLSFSKIPYSIRILIENILLNSDKIGYNSIDYILQLYDYKNNIGREIPFYPSRVILQDFTGVPAVVDLAAMRDGIIKLGKGPESINPKLKSDLIIDHSIQVDEFGSIKAFENNISKEFERNRERYEFLKWGSKAFNNLNIIPPSSGIIHQINLEHLSEIITTKKQANSLVLTCDTLVGTDSHTTMIGGLGVLGWGVGGIEAEACMLGFPITITIPEVVGFKLTGRLKNEVNATDLALTITKILREKGVVGKFVEFFGDGVDSLSLPDRATVSNMSPEYGATISFFPVDDNTIEYLENTGRDTEIINRVKLYSDLQELLKKDQTEEINYSNIIELNLEEVSSAIAGPRKPHEYIRLNKVKDDFSKILSEYKSKTTNKRQDYSSVEVVIDGEKIALKDGTVVIAAITSCTNTSNPFVLVSAGLLAKRAVELGLRRFPLTKTSFTPGSRVVEEYLNNSGLMPYFESLGFHIVGYGCATCIGNSGPLNPEISKAIKNNNIYAVSVLSGNRNFEGRIHPDVRGNFLASPPLVIAYSIAGNINIDITSEPVGYDPNGREVYLKDIYPSNEEVMEIIRTFVDKSLFSKIYKDVLKGNNRWESIAVETDMIYRWKNDSTYIKRPPFFKDISPDIEENRGIKDARVLAVLGDTVTTDHISPAGAIPIDSPAGKWLLENGVKPEEFNTYGSRRGNHEVMVRGTFANIRLRNRLVPDIEGGFTIYFPTEKIMTIFDASELYKKNEIPLIILAGKEYGSGSSRDWAAKGTKLLGVKAVIAKSFERIHRSNLIGMGVLPLQFNEGEGVEELGLTGREIYYIDKVKSPGEKIKVSAKNGNKIIEFTVTVRIDSSKELEYYNHGGILNYALRKIANG